MSTGFQPHEIEWTTEKSSNFWDHFAEATAATPDQYFSYQLGEYLLAHVSEVVPLKGRILDYGSGPGYLIGHLLQHGLSCEALDFSPASVEQTRQQFSGNPLFRGATIATGLPTPLPDASMDVVFCVEVVEHLLEEHLAPTLAELHRLVRPAGTVVVTTPNEENLTASKVLCPECGCLFHRYQHLRSWSAETLRRAMEAEGFETINCRATTFGPRPKLAGLRKFLGRLRGRAEPAPITLVYIGRRSQG
jgi:2-polyprenyl-3-methyl-5-hydroxy-6-metoxy-1,4-benzoquinol methylase